MVYFKLLVELLVCEGRGAEAVMLLHDRLSNCSSRSEKQHVLVQLAFIALFLVSCCYTFICSLFHSLSTIQILNSLVLKSQMQFDDYKYSEKDSFDQK